MSALDAFFLISPRRAARLCRQTASVRPALEILRTTPPGWGAGEGGSISQRRPVRLDAAQLTSQQQHTCAFLADRGGQEGRQSVRSAPSGGKSPRSSFNTKTSRAAEVGGGCTAVTDG